MKKRGISRNPKNGNGPKYQKSLQTLALKLLKDHWQHFIKTKIQIRFSFDT